MKLLSLNVAMFEDNSEALFDFIQKQNADILCLQEVTRRLDTQAYPQYVSIDAIDKASESLRDAFFGPTWVLSFFEKNNFHGKEHFYFDVGGKVEFGNYVKSRYKILTAKNVFVENDFTYVTDWSNWPHEDQRAVEVVDCNVNGKKLRILNYHGIWSQNKVGNEKTLKACKKIAKLASEVDAAIICGDFNLFPDTESIAVLNKNFISLVDTFKINTTRPSTNELNDKKRNIVDYIFVTEAVTVKNFSVINENVSDHLPLVLEFNI